MNRSRNLQFTAHELGEKATMTARRLVILEELCRCSIPDSSPPEQGLRPGSLHIVGPPRLARQPCEPRESFPRRAPPPKASCTVREFHCQQLRLHVTLV